MLTRLRLVGSLALVLPALASAQAPAAAGSAGLSYRFGHKP